MNRSARRIPALSVVSAILILTAFSALAAAPAASAERECPPRSAQKEDCNDLAGCLPDGLTLEGCWTCKRDIYVKSSLWRLRLRGEYVCTSDDGSTITIDFDLPLSKLFGGDPCIG